MRVADVDRVVFAAYQQPVDAVDQVRNVAEAAGLFAVAVNGYRLALQCLRHEVRHRAPVLKAHVRAVGVEDPEQPHLHVVVAVVGHGHGLGEALGLVVNAARADGVDVAPVGLMLRVYQRVAVNLGGGGYHKDGFLFLGEPQGFVGAQRADFQRGDGELQVIDGGGGAGEMHYRVQLAGDVQVVGDVVLGEFELRVLEQVLDIVDVACYEVVYAYYGMAFAEQVAGKVTA